MGSIPSTMSSTNPNPNTLEDLPTEQLCEIVSHLDNRSLFNLRLTSKTLQQHTLLPFSDRFTKTTDTNFIPAKLETLVRMFESESLSSRVKTLRIWGTLNDGADVPPLPSWGDQRLELLAKLWSKMRTITYLAVGSRVSHRNFGNHSQSGVLRALMDVIAASPSEHLNHFDIEHASLDYKSLMECLAAHASVLKNLKFKTCVLQGGNWTDVLHYIFDNMALDKLHIEALSSGFKNVQRVELGTVPWQPVKNEGAKGLQFFLVNNGFATMVGKNGVEAGLIKLFGFEKKVDEVKEKPTFVSVYDEKPHRPRRSSRVRYRNFWEL